MWSNPRIPFAMSSERPRYAPLTVLVIAELRQPGGNPFKMPDRLFVAATFTVAFIYGVVLLASRVFP